MKDLNWVLRQMMQYLDTWNHAGDRRAEFLECYRLMSTNMTTAIREGQFVDPDWISRLLVRFSDYYFDALTLYERYPDQSPAVWRQAHDSARNREAHVLQNLLLGINAHINHDLPLALYDCLYKDWPELNEEQRQGRLSDHETVNRVIARTIDAVQDTIVEPESPLLGVIDKIMGRMDEWMLSRLITSWRHDVWNVAQGLLAAPNDHSRFRLQQEQQDKALERGRLMIEVL